MLYSLPIIQMVQFKVCTLVYRAVHGPCTDVVVKSMVIPRRRDLRSSAHSHLISAPHRRQFAERAFAVAGQMLWNSLRDAVCDATSLEHFVVYLRNICIL